jgi:hypothetical protein
LLGILFGPLFVIESSIHAQLDMVAASFSAAGLVVWNRLDGDRRAVVAGVLFGAAILIKAPPGVAVIGLAVTARSRRELALLLGTTVGVAIVGAAPWLISEHHALKSMLDYQGVPGFGGISLIVQRSLALPLLSGRAVVYTNRYVHIEHAGHVITAVVAGLTAVVLIVRRPPAELGATMMVLALYAGAPNMFLWYLLWILPLLYVSGRVLAATLLQVVLLIPVVVIYTIGIEESVGAHVTLWPVWVTEWLYTPVMDAVCLGSALLLIWLAVQLLRGPRHNFRGRGNLGVPWRTPRHSSSSTSATQSRFSSS